MKLFILAFLFFPMISIAEGYTHRTDGDWIQGRKSDFRYVTFYNVKKIKKPLQGFPWIEEDCHDQGNRFASWSKSLSYEIAYSGGLNFPLLGFLEIDLGMERSKTIEFTFQRWVTPTFGIKARHVLHEEYENWVGETRIEYSSGGTTYWAGRAYPFSLSKMNYGISVERINVLNCEG